MKRHLSIKTAGMIVLALVVAGCSLFEGDAGPGSPPGDPVIKILLSEDFEGHAPGDFSSDIWVVDRGTNDGGIVEIVEAPELDSGRAVRIVGNPAGGETRITYKLPDDQLVGVETLIIEHRFKAVSGSSSNNYINNATHNLNWRVLPSNGTVGFNSQGIGMRDIGDYVEGEWNLLRLVARVKENEVDIYLNDMDTPIIEGTGFRVPMDSWVGSSFRIQHSSVSTPADISYGDIKVWTVD